MNKKIMIFAAVILAFAGCEEEKEKEVPSFIPSGEYVTIDMGEETRTSLSSDNVVTWTAGDAVGMFCAQTECANVQVVLPECEGKTSVSVKTPVQYNDAGGDHQFYMYYPYSVITGAANGTTTVKSRLKHQQNGLLRDVAFTMAKCKVPAPAAGEFWGKVKAEFHNPFAYIRFCVKDTRADQPARTIHNVSIEAITASSTVVDGKEVVDAASVQTDRTAVFAGVFTADLTVDYPYANPTDQTKTQPVEFDPNDVTNIIYVNPDKKPKVVDGSGHETTGGYNLDESILMLINAGVFTGTNKYFRITFSFSDGTVGYAIKNAKEFERNKIYNYGFKYENLNFNNESTIRIWPWTEIRNAITFD